MEMIAETASGAEKHLWCAVITSAIGDWVSGPLRRKDEAERYLFADDTDFPRVCESAGLDVERLRMQLQRIRAQGLPKEIKGKNRVQSTSAHTL
jgi:hypothetical protein